MSISFSAGMCNVWRDIDVANIVTKPDVTDEKITYTVFR